MFGDRSGAPPSTGFRGPQRLVRQRQPFPWNEVTTVASSWLLGTAVASQLINASPAWLYLLSRTPGDAEECLRHLLHCRQALPLAASMRLLLSRFFKHLHAGARRPCAACPCHWGKANQRHVPSSSAPSLTGLVTSTGDRLVNLPATLFARASCTRHPADSRGRGGDSHWGRPWGRSVSTGHEHYHSAVSY